MKLISTRAILALGSVLVASATSAQAATFDIGSFSSQSGFYSYIAGSLNGSTTGPFEFSADAIALLGAPSGLFANATLTVDADATGNVQPTGFFNTYAQLFAGSIAVMDGGTNLLTMSFTNGALFGVIPGGTQASLVGSSAAGTVITYTSDVFDASGLVDPEAFNFVLTPTTPALTINGNNFSNFVAPDAANFSTSVNDSSVPEPMTMSLLGVGLLGAGLARRRRS